MDNICFVYGCSRRFSHSRGVQAGSLPIGIRLCDDHAKDYDSIVRTDCERAGYVYDKDKVQNLITRIRFFVS